MRLCSAPLTRPLPSATRLGGDAAGADSRLHAVRLALDSTDAWVDGEGSEASEAELDARLATLREGEVGRLFAKYGASPDGDGDNGGGINMDFDDLSEHDEL